MSDLAVREVPVGRILDLRHRVLRIGLPPESAHFPGDDAPGTRHFAVQDGERVVGCATYLTSSHDGEPAWQLRGMATEPNLQKKGVGRTLTESSLLMLAKETPKLFWCNARTSAVGFYERMGWQILGSEFDIPGVGPHFKMTWRAA